MHACVQRRRYREPCPAFPECSLEGASAPAGLEGEAVIIEMRCSPIRSSQVHVPSSRQPDSSEYQYGGARNGLPISQPSGDKSPRHRLGVRMMAVLGFGAASPPNGDKSPRHRLGVRMTAVPGFGAAAQPSGSKLPRQGVLCLADWSANKYRSSSSDASERYRCFEMCNQRRHNGAM
ncbi:hypothetical protein SAMN03159382_03565 [Pseudomonas sp. NFACC23-1]|nr:hypothetical protein SAMN03159386_03435 [Pseudomonas sp. NFACC17-2]SEJ64692.1 hypothetical protein SAMN03159382_03565 [Pseudomonas sp. NFACC23-1]SFW81600.1 hypothetical protein SAMN05660640_03911 [Pseudomonas sp. NFACC16-2]